MHVVKPQHFLGNMFFGQLWADERNVHTRRKRNIMNKKIPMKYTEEAQLCDAVGFQSQAQSALNQGSIKLED